MSYKKYHIHISAKTEEDVKKELADVAYIITGLREHTKKWQQYYGAPNRNNMKLWEQKADEWINKHKIIIEDEFKSN